MPLPADVEAGVTFERRVVDNLTRTQIVQYAGASGDYNPIHTDEVFATKVAGYPSVFAQGMLTMGLTGRMLTDRVGHDPLARFGGRFLSQVWFKDRLTARAVATQVRDGVADLLVTTISDDGVEVFSGYASARVGG